MPKFTKYLTREDAAILNRLQPSPNFDRGAADSVDYRAMLARVRNVGETIRRGENYGYDSDVIYDVLISEPARIVRAEMSYGTPFHEMVEQRDGRRLA